MRAEKSVKTRASSPRFFLSQKGDGWVVAGSKNGRNRNLLSSLSLELIVHSKDEFVRLSMKIPHSSLSFNVPYKDSTCAYSSPLCSFCVLNLLWLRQMCLVVPLRLLATMTLPPP